MGYRSQVAAAIGGKPEQIKKFVKALASKTIADQFKILNEFEIVKLEPDLSVYVFYNDYIKWSEEAKTTWRALREFAEQFELSFIFHRLGENEDDTELDDNCDKAYFDYRLLELFSYHRCIDINHQRLHDAILSS